MKSCKKALNTVASAAIIASVSGTAFADLLPDNPLIGTSGDGIIFSDPAEGVLPPGAKAVTFTNTRDDGGSNQNPIFLPEPEFEGVTDFSGLSRRSEATNCLMANNPDIYCDSARGSGKRIKVQLFGPTPFDITYRTLPGAVDSIGENFSTVGGSGSTVVDTRSVDYFTFGKVSNLTGARITGYTLQLLDADGALMNATAGGVLFNLDASAIGLNSNLPDGLFGNGGNEGNIGFFTSEQADFELGQSDQGGASNVLEFGRQDDPGITAAIDNAFHTDNFGDAFLDDIMVPDGLFWDDNNDPTDESALVAWYDIGGSGWTFGNLDADSSVVDTLLDEIEAELGLADDALSGVGAGDPVPADVVAAAEANSLFEVAPIEDLRNANQNYTITIGTVAGDQFTLRTVPTFAPIVEEAVTEFQFKAAGYLDAAANVPYWDLGNSGVYQTAIGDILDLDEEEQALALTSTAFNLAPNMAALSLESGRNQVAAITNLPSTNPGDEGITATRSAGGQSWQILDGLEGIVSLGGSTATVDSQADFSGYDASAASFLAGLQRNLGEGTSAGLAIGGSTGQSTSTDDLGEVEQTSYSLVAFVRSELANGVSVQGIFGYQGLDFETTRNVLGEAEVADGSTDGSQLFGAIQAEALYDVGALKVGPMAAAEFYNVSVDGFTETGADEFNLVVGDQSSNTVVGSIGVKAMYQMPGASGDTSVTGSVAYTSVSSDDGEFDNAFVGLPSAVLPLYGLNQDLVEVAVGFKSVIRANTSGTVAISGGYGGSFGDGFERHGVSVGLGVEF